MSKVSDRWLWFGVGILAFMAVKGISYGLHEVVRVTAIYKPNKNPHNRSSTPEVSAADSIQIKSLVTLAKSSNVEIAQAATTLLCDRFSRSKSCMRALASDLISTDRLVRQRATKTRLMLEENNTGGYSIFERRSYERAAHSPYMSSSLGLPDPSGVHLPVPISAHSRQHDASEAEQTLRRRRREAMVFHEGNGPLSNTDIHQRLGTAPADATTRDIEAVELATTVMDVLDRSLTPQSFSPGAHIRAPGGSQFMDEV
ncbi:hypothetical protein EJ05DRAFT_542111 [Pseudovirgaria hyperparasitica]|uniref:Uncharacterized protein n=1 Tax=Pseudovirgaria hyperparasitica TaxID=470096 RepID=A0A6A6VVI9_9PEZI|nr:uncharacterized protein EJ05DRAFT_542111 [Pseudovirgaria hyperparasitica]KAF2753261.1 hypothetical protein EJ05DRAFT_542111 [Pseudovirgaria hyperparasitica]